MPDILRKNEKKRRIKSILTFFQHADFETFHEAAGLARLASPFGDLTLVGGWTAVLNIPCHETNTVTVKRIAQKDNITVNIRATYTHVGLVPR